MCDMNNDCDYEGEMSWAYGGKDICLYCDDTDQEYRIPYRISVEICPECGEANWQSLG